MNGPVVPFTLERFGGEWVPVFDFTTCMQWSEDGIVRFYRRMEGSVPDVERERVIRRGTVPLARP